LDDPATETIQTACWLRCVKTSNPSLFPIPKFPREFMAHTVIDPEAFARHIERVVVKHKTSYMDALLDFCEKRSLEPEAIAPFLSDKIIHQLEREGVALHLLPKTANNAQLPLD
jgi:hypothetical protein